MSQAIEVGLTSIEGSSFFSSLILNWCKENYTRNYWFIANCFAFSHKINETVLSSSFSSFRRLSHEMTESVESSALSSVNLRACVMYFRRRRR